MRSRLTRGRPHGHYMEHLGLLPSEQTRGVNSVSFSSSNCTPRQRPHPTLLPTSPSGEGGLMRTGLPFGVMGTFWNQTEVVLYTVDVLHATEMLALMWLPRWPSH